MATTSSESSGVVEQVINTAVDDVPGVRSLWKIGSERLSTKKIRTLVVQGRGKIHEAAVILREPETKAALDRIDVKLYKQLRREHSMCVYHLSFQNQCPV